MNGSVFIAVYQFYRAAVLRQWCIELSQHCVND